MWPRDLLPQPVGSRTLLPKLLRRLLSARPPRPTWASCARHSSAFRCAAATAVRACAVSVAAALSRSRARAASLRAVASCESRS